MKYVCPHHKSINTILPQLVDYWGEWNIFGYVWSAVMKSFWTNSPKALNYYYMTGLRHISPLRQDSVWDGSCTGHGCTHLCQARVEHVCQLVMVDESPGKAVVILINLQQAKVVWCHTAAATAAVTSAAVTTAVVTSAASCTVSPTALAAAMVTTFTVTWNCSHQVHTLLRSQVQCWRPHRLRCLHLSPGVSLMSRPMVSHQVLLLLQ